MDVTKYRALFVEESREHLAQLSRLLVAMESAGAPALETAKSSSGVLSSPNPVTPSNPANQLLDEIFRVIHSLKGMAASMGYDPITSLSHRMEDVAGILRATPSPLFSNVAYDPRDPQQPKVIDLLLRGVDVLIGQVNNIAEGLSLQQDYDLLHRLKTIADEAKPRPAEVSSSLTSTATASTPAATAETADAATHAVEHYGQVVRITLSVGCSAPAVRAYLVHRRLSQLATLLEATPSLEELKEGQMKGREIKLVFSTAVADADVQRLIKNIPDVDSAVCENLLKNSRVRSNENTPAAPALKMDRIAESRALDSLATATAATVRVRTEVLDELIDSVGELFLDRERLRSLLGNDPLPELRAALDGLATRVRRIHDQVMAVRMMPMRVLTDRYPRMVRDLAQSLGKSAQLRIEGDDIELDRAILDHLDAPFVHVLRNALDHGLESSLEREAAGKSSIGMIVLTASRNRDRVEVVIEDDGKGMDLEELRRIAVRRGLFTAEAAAKLSDHETRFLVCLPGFSTKSEVSAISGRGVGMDVVRAQIEVLGGSLDIESEKGRGSRIVFRLPLTLAIVPALLTESGGRMFAVPVSKVVGVREMASETYQHINGTCYLATAAGLVPVIVLSEALRLDSTKKPEQVLLIEQGRSLHALAVDRITGYREVVVKPLGEPLDRVEWFSGATILGDGRPILILDLHRALRARVAA